MRLEPKGPPDPLHRRYREAAGLRHAAGTPMDGVLGATLQRPHDHGFDAGIVNRTWRAGARLVMQPVHAPLHQTPPPLAYRRPVQAQLGCHFLVLTAFHAGQYDPGSQSQRLRLFRRIVSDFSSARSSSLNVRGGQIAGPPLDPPSRLPPSRQRCEPTANLRLRTCDTGH